MGEQELSESFDQILKKYLKNERSLQNIPGIRNFRKEILGIEIFDEISFPWSLQEAQKECLEYLEDYWLDFLNFDQELFRKTFQFSSQTNLKNQNASD